MFLSLGHLGFVGFSLHGFSWLLCQIPALFLASFPIVWSIGNTTGGETMGPFIVFLEKNYYHVGTK